MKVNLTLKNGIWIHIARKILKKGVKHLWKHSKYPLYKFAIYQDGQWKEIRITDVKPKGF